MIEISEIENIKHDWNILVKDLNEKFDNDLDLQGIIFLIGVQEFGKGHKDFSKDEKQDLMHVATCKLMSYDGFYKFEKLDEDGWPHYLNIKPLPRLSLRDQDLWLRKNIIRYFKEMEL